MAQVRIDFNPPPEENIARFRLYESAVAEGPFVLIDSTTEVGFFPDYISTFTTTNATSSTDWFAIQWEDVDGNLTDLSQPIRGGTGTMVDELVERVFQRDTSLSKAVIAQEAEAAIQAYTGVDPYDPTLQLTYVQLNGMTHLILAKTLLIEMISASSVESASIGLVSFKSGQVTTHSTTFRNIEELLKLANKELGLVTTAIMLMEEVQLGSSVTSWRDDKSRLVLEVGTE